MIKPSTTSSSLNVVIFAYCPERPMRFVLLNVTTLCSHDTKISSWLPPAESWNSGELGLPYGWEAAVGKDGKTYFINLCALSQRVSLVFGTCMVQPKLDGLSLDIYLPCRISRSALACSKLGWMKLALS
ncbi:FRMPD3 [Cordylochernes scorpioides]|uniref:FRMPD3 n=1 Tax=Cordylochernes scorpioides TaxID=51811 RepID=A0ABY6K0R2_9ARAC|nr:FRMPD3 [Cordylochernes scorpioides]